MTAVSGTEPRPRQRLPDREAEALAEVAATVGGAPWRWALVGAFLLSIAAGPVLEVSPGWRARTASWPRSHVAWPRAEVLRAALDRGGLPDLNFVLRGSIQSIDRYIERDAVVSRLLRAPVQSRLRDRLGYGNGQVIAGSDTWLFYQHEFAAIVGAPFLAPETLARRARPGWRLYPVPRPDPVAGLTRFAAQLERHGARLVLMIAPSKAAVSPEKLAGSVWAAPPRNPSLEQLVRRLEAAGVAVYDPVPELFAAARHRDDLFLDEDSHWSPEGLEICARGLARRIERANLLEPRPPAGFVRRPARIPKRIELERLLGLPRPDPQEEKAMIDVVEIAWPDGRRFLPKAADADVVLLGDSYSMVFSQLEGTGRSAGLPEHLAAALDRPVRVLANFERNELAQRAAWLRKEPEVLSRARVVVFEVAERAFSINNWAPGRLGPPQQTRQRQRPGRRRKEVP